MNQLGCCWGYGLELLQGSYKGYDGKGLGLKGWLRVAFGLAMDSENRLHGYILWLEGCPKDDVVGGSMIDRILVGYEKKNDKRYMKTFL
ncbi:hypothetical protein BHE74_00054913 [Ensete ventricosum]|nr:hypothetical protein GW17_00043255 [Ensete ventricosum]RWW39723.1 hypothetical protein BHE74_00054913 [Ensete ventricosum]